MVRSAHTLSMLSPSLAIMERSLKIKYETDNGNFIRLTWAKLTAVLALPVRSYEINEITVV